MISNSREILDAADVKDVLTSIGIELDRNNRCRCPVHGGDDKNFSVKNGIGHCFSQCGRNFDAIDLLIELNKITFPEALEWIANHHQIEIKYSGNVDRLSEIHEAKKKTERQKELHVITHQVAEYYHAQFMQRADAARARIGDRDFSQEIIARFRIGYAPAGNVLVKGAAGGGSHALQELGLIRVSKSAEIVTQGDSGAEGPTSEIANPKLYDHFRDRTMFPVFDQKGNIAGFSGRKAHDDTNEKNPKYLNSYESIAYEKDKLLYGLWQGRDAIRKKGFAYIVEGNTDVVSLHDNGIENTVAACGTAFTDEQARLLHKYCDVAILLFDGDSAGTKAADRSVAILLGAGFNVRVILLPEDEDPDSYVRKLGTEDFRKFIDEKAEDALIWKATQRWMDGDIPRQEECISTAARLLSYLKSDVQREMYITKLSKKWGPSSKASIKKSIKELEEEDLKRSKKSLLSMKEVQDVQRYGIYSRNNKYYETQSSELLGYPISNFIIKPIMLIVGTDRSARLVEVINEFGQSFIKDIDSDDFVELNTLRKQVERRGNFIFSGKAESYLKIKHKVYSDMSDAYPVTILGYHAKKGFWAWGNGITVGDQFMPVDEYGLVSHDGVKYFLPAFSKVHADMLSDDQENNYEEEKKLIYISGDCMSIQQWVHTMRDVYGSNGLIAACFYFAATYRDVIISKIKSFPHLNLFGPSGTGKSYLAWSLTAMYGVAKGGFNLSQGTQVAFYRRLSQVRNAVAWYDEYSNAVDFKRIEALKSVFDNTGHEKGIATTDNRTITTKPNSAIILSGQQQPVQDIALFKRCVSLNFSSSEFTPEQSLASRKLKDIEISGVLSQITSQLHSFRPTVVRDFDRYFDEIKTRTLQKLGTLHVETRIMENHVILLTAYMIIKDLLDCHSERSVEKSRDLPPTSEVFDAIILNITQQSSAIFNEDELSIFWKMVAFFLDSKQINHLEDVMVEDCTRVSLMLDEKNSKVTEFDAPRRILFMRFTKIHPLYLELHRRQFNKGGLGLGALQHYLTASKAFVGQCKAKKFKGKTYRCWLFDMDRLDIEIPTSDDILDYLKDEPAKTAQPDATSATDTPF